MVTRYLVLASALLILVLAGAGWAAGLFTAKTDCCQLNLECCNPPSECCLSVKAKADCCAAGLNCCTPASVCCPAAQARSGSSE